MVIISVCACKYEPVEVPNNPNTGSGTNTGGNTGGGTTPTPKPCSPDTAYFKNDVLPILSSNCAKSGCHDAISKAKDVQLTDYQNVMREIKAFNLSNSDLYKYITINDAKKIMPPLPSAALSVAQKETIAKWILQGAKNNSCDANAAACDTKNVTFSKEIKAIMDKNCVGCHAASFPAANINLTTYTGVAASAKSGSLYGSISHNLSYSKMPKNAAQLSQCDIDKVKAWIDAGAKNN